MRLLLLLVLVLPNVMAQENRFEGRPVTSVRVVPEGNFLDPGPGDLTQLGYDLVHAPHQSLFAHHLRRDQWVKLGDQLEIVHIARLTAIVLDEIAQRPQFFFPVWLVSR